jgi:hypothetical protein
MFFLNSLVPKKEPAGWSRVRYAGQYLGILRPCAQENLSPPPPLFRIQLCGSKNNTKKTEKRQNIVFSVLISLKSIFRGQPFFPRIPYSISIFFNMSPLETCRPGPGPLWPVRKYGPVDMYLYSKTSRPTMELTRPYSQQGLQAFSPRVKANSHIPCRSSSIPYCQGFRLCLSHLIYTAWPCLIHTCHAAPELCQTLLFWKRPVKVMAQRGMDKACVN